jgi:hypothetical protein
MKFSRKWLAALLAAVLPEIYPGTKIPTNPADFFSDSRGQTRES